MDATTVGVDLAKNVFEIALADERGHIVERHRLSRARFDRFFVNRPACRIVMEACGSAHHHARRLSSHGHDVLLLPAQYARAYVRRNKTDAADAAALIEAARCPDIRPVPIKSVDQQALQQLHRLRSQWMAARTARIDFLRGCLREFGVCIPVGAQRAIQSVRDALSNPASPVPMLLHSSLIELLAEIESLDQRCKHIERELARLNEHDPIVERLLQIPGVGPLTATALRASVVDVQRFHSEIALRESRFAPHHYQLGFPMFSGSKPAGAVAHNMLTHGHRIATRPTYFQEASGSHKCPGANIVVALHSSIIQQTCPG